MKIDDLMSRSELGGEPMRTTCEYQWEVLIILNNPPPVCLCVDVNKHKSQRERNKRNYNISLSTMQNIYISFVISDTFSEVIYQNSKYRNTSFNIFITKARVFCIFVVIRGEGQSLESLWRHPTHEW